MLKNQHTTIMHLRWDKVRGPVRWEELLDQMEDETGLSDDDPDYPPPRLGRI